MNLRLTLANKTPSFKKSANQPTNQPIKKMTRENTKSQGLAGEN